MDRKLTMKTTKILFFLFTLPLFLFSFSNCGGAQNKSDLKLVENPPFKIADVYYQNWVAGVRDGGSGTNIHISLSDIQPGVKVKDIYFRGQRVDAKYSALEPGKYVGYLNNKTSNDVIMDSDPTKEAQNTPADPIPFKISDNEAVISYFVDGQKNYYKISNMSQKDMLAYPQVKHNE